LMMGLTVKALYEEGTTPVLAVTVEPIAEDWSRRLGR